MSDTTFNPAIENGPEGPFGRHLILTGALVIGFFLSGLGLWLAYAPIESAVVAPGIIHVHAGSKTVQHLSGGVVSEILVQEGDQVEAGDVLIRLQDTRQRSQWKQLRGQYFGALANAARIYAERAAQPSILFPIELQEQTENEEVQIAMAAQRNLFNSRQQLQQDQLQAQQQRLKGLNAEIEAITQQIKSGEKQMALSLSLIDYYRTAATDRESQSRILQLKMDNARIEGELSAMKVSLARARQAILETELEFTTSRVNAEKTLELELREFTALVYDLQQQLDVAKDELRRMTIKAHANGQVKHLRVDGENFVVRPGEALMDIVPDYEELIVEASIDARDIAEVQVGVEALVELTLANRRTSKPIEGRVKWISVGSQDDPVSGRRYHRAKIELDRLSIRQQNLLLQPGMGAEVMVRTAARSPIEFLTQPVSRNFATKSAND